MVLMAVVVSMTFVLVTRNFLFQSGLCVGEDWKIFNH